MSATTVISFARGVPSADMLPVDQLAAAAARVFENDPTGALAYGAAEGYLPLREWVARKYEAPVERTMLVNGSLQGFAFVAEALFAGSGGRAVVEAPTYDRALLTLKRFGATVDTVQLDADGLDVDALEAQIAAGRVPGLVYTIPTFQNPGGVTLSRERRERLVALAAEHGFFIYEDDPYGDLRFTGADVPTMYSLDTASRVIFATSFTKTIAPGVRTGVLILPEALFGKVRSLAVDTYIAPTHLSEAVLAEYVGAGEFEPGVARATALLKERCDALCGAIDRHLGGRAEYVKPEGGYFLWLRLPGVDTDALAARAQEAGVPLVKGSSCFPDDRGRDSVRLAFSACSAEEMEPGIARLAALL